MSRAWARYAGLGRGWLGPAWFGADHVIALPRCDIRRLSPASASGAPRGRFATVVDEHTGGRDRAARARRLDLLVVGGGQGRQVAGDGRTGHLIQTTSATSATASTSPSASVGAVTPARSMKQSVLSTTVGAMLFSRSPETAMASAASVIFSVASASPQRFRRGADLGQDVDAVLVLVDHLRDAAHLSSTRRSRLRQPVLVCGVSVHECLQAEDAGQGPACGQEYPAGVQRGFVGRQTKGGERDGPVPAQSGSGGKSASDRAESA